MARKRRHSAKRPKRHPRFGATKATGERNARARDRANIEFLTGEVSTLKRSLTGLVQSLRDKGVL